MMAEQLKPCPFCGNEHPEIASGDSVICNTDGHTGCGCSAFYDRWNERTPGPATTDMLTWAKNVANPSYMIRAFLAEWPDLPTVEQPASPWKCCFCGEPVRIASDLTVWHFAGPTNHEAELSSADKKILADSLGLSD